MFKVVFGVVVVTVGVREEEEGIGGMVRESVVKV